ncbi:rho guanine nucleotide exchange factor 4 isoform X1 [Pelobates cultripes]|uniref:Rho guanine nucleotide exchange factor 4 isoform X1 n=1 Tax=Pelobates cultripes TaxID=61616 RepID=A0AAD1RAN2_PELCU|nr:rho guanine nucleotide exchange factor 4 isoform X1 [Pelobates cultripes]
MLSVMYFLRSFFKTPQPNEDSSNKPEFQDDIYGVQCPSELSSFSQEQDEDYFEARSYFSESPSELKSEVFESVSDFESISSDTTDCTCLEKEDLTSTHTENKTNIHSSDTREGDCPYQDQADNSSCLHLKHFLITPQSNLTSEIVALDSSQAEQEFTVLKPLPNSEPSNKTSDDEVTVNGLQSKVKVCEERIICRLGSNLPGKLKTARLKETGAVSKSDDCQICTQPEIQTLRSGTESLSDILVTISDHESAVPESTSCRNIDPTNKEEISIKNSLSNEHLFVNTPEGHKYGCLATPNAGAIKQGDTYSSANGVIDHISQSSCEENTLSAANINSIYKASISLDAEGEELKSCCSITSKSDRDSPREKALLIVADSVKTTYSRNCSEHRQTNSTKAEHDKPIQTDVQCDINNIETPAGLEVLPTKNHSASGDLTIKPLIIISIERTDAQATRNKIECFDPTGEQIASAGGQSNNISNFTQECSSEVSNGELANNITDCKQETTAQYNNTEEDISTDVHIAMRTILSTSFDISQDNMTLQASPEMQRTNIQGSLDRTCSSDSYGDDIKYNILYTNIVCERVTTDSDSGSDEYDFRFTEFPTTELDLDSDTSEEQNINNSEPQDINIYESTETSIGESQLKDHNDGIFMAYYQEEMKTVCESSNSKYVDIVEPGMTSESEGSRLDSTSNQEIEDKDVYLNNCEFDTAAKNKIPETGDEPSAVPSFSEIPVVNFTSVEGGNKEEENDMVNEVDVKNNAQCNSLQPCKIAIKSGGRLAIVCKDEQASDISDDDLFGNSFLYNRSMRKASGPGRIDLDNFARFRNSVSNVSMPNPTEMSQDANSNKPQIDTQDQKMTKNAESNRLKERLSWAHKSFSSFFDFKNLEKENENQSCDNLSKEEKKKARPQQTSWRALRKSKDKDLIKRRSMLSLSTNIINPSKLKRPFKDKLEHSNGNVSPILDTPTSVSPGTNTNSESSEDNSSELNSENHTSKDLDIHCSSKIGASVDSFCEESDISTILKSNETQSVYKQQPMLPHSQSFSNYDIHSMPCRPMSPKPQSQWPSFQRRSLRNSRMSATSMTSLGNCSPIEGCLDSPDISMILKPWLVHCLDNESQKDDSGISSQSQASLHTASSTSDILRDDENRQQNQKTPTKIPREKIALLLKRKSSDLLASANNCGDNKNLTLPLMTSIGNPKDSEQKTVKALFRSFSCDALWVNERSRKWTLEKADKTTQAQILMANQLTARIRMSAAPPEIFRILPMKIHSFSQSTPTRLDLVGCVRRVTYPVIADGTLDRPTLIDDLGSDEDFYEDLHVSSHRYGGGGEQLAINEVHTGAFNSIIVLLENTETYVLTYFACV